MPSSKEAKFGTLIHRVMEFIYQDPAQPASKEATLQHLNYLWQKEMSDNLFETKGEQRAYFSNAQHIINEYFQKENLGKNKIIALEKYFQVPFFDVQTQDTHFITGRIDRVDKHPDGTFEVIDYKTSARLPNETILDEDLQLPLYHLGVTELWPKLLKKQERPIKLTLYYLRHGEKITFKKTAEELTRVKKEVLQTIRQIQASLKHNDFPARFSPLCEFYPNSTICPYTRHKHHTEQEPETPDESTIRELTDEFFQLKRQEKEINNRLSEIKYQLHAYMDKQELEGLYSPAWQKMVQRHEMPRYEYEWQEVKNTLEPLGLWEKALTISNSALNSLLQELSSEQAEKIKNARYKTGTTLTLRERKT